MPARPVMHPGQLAPTAATVAALVREQFPRWSGLTVREVDSPGTVNALFRVGADLVARLPLQPGDPAVRREQQAHEFALAERLLAAGLPADTPHPVATGAPGNGFPLPWSVWRWLPGRSAYDLEVGADVGVARAVADYVRAVRAIDTAVRGSRGRTAAAGCASTTTPSRAGSPTPTAWSTPPRWPGSGTGCVTPRTTPRGTPGRTATSCPATCWSRRGR